MSKSLLLENIFLKNAKKFPAEK